MTRINFIDISNYRQHRQSRFDFRKKNAKGFDMHLILAENGIGKTNVMNATTWCLYELEPYSDERNDQLPLCNREVLNDAREKGEEFVTVTITLNITRDDSIYNFVRSVDIPVATPFSKRVSKLTVKVTAPDGNSDSLEGEEARKLAELCFPPKIRDYIFFDSEHLSSYFDRRDNDSNLKDAINEIAQINVLNMAVKHLDDYIKECTGIMSKFNPKLKEKQQAVDELEAKFNRLDADIAQLKATNAEAKSKINTLNKLLNGNENVADDNKLCDELTERIKELDANERALDASKKKLVRKYYVVMSMYDVNKSTRDYIRDMEDKGQLPSSFDSNEIRKSLATHECAFCKTGLDHTAEEHLKSLLDQLEISTKAGAKLTEIKNDVEQACREAHKYKSELDAIHESLRNLETERDGLLGRREDVSRRLSANSDVGSVTNWIKQKAELEELRELNDRKIGGYERERSHCEVELRTAKEELVKAQKNTEKCDEARMNQEIAREMRDIIDEVRKEASTTIKTNMESVAMEWFNNLIWKKNSFKAIQIGENYDVKLIDNDDMSCLGSCSAAERQLLALAFTLALHKVSGHDSLLFIDTPVGRVSGLNRSNFAEGLLTTSHEKQVILTVTSSEFREELESVFTPEYRSSMVSMTMDEAEKYVKLEVR